MSGASPTPRRVTAGAAVGTTIADNATKQIELFPAVRRVPAKKVLVYYGAPQTRVYSDVVTSRDLGVPMNTKVDVYLEFANREAAGLGVPLPAGRVRVSQLDAADDALAIALTDATDRTARMVPISTRARMRPLDDLACR